MLLPTTDEILDAAEHLPHGAMLVMPRVSWDDYERVLERLAERPHFRVSYDRGILEIMSPRPEHGAYEHLISDLVLVACQVLRLKVEKCGSTTWKRRMLARGVEADGSYYIQNARNVIGNLLKADVESVPPPDIAVEIDVTNSSASKFGIYAALAVPELWHYSGQTFQFYQLSRGKYRLVDVSPSIPCLTGEMLGEALELSKTKGQDAARVWFRRKFRSLVKSTLPPGPRPASRR
jgi:Uma2 family endonuclease